MSSLMSMKLKSWKIEYLGLALLNTESTFFPFSKSISVQSLDLEIWFPSLQLVFKIKITRSLLLSTSCSWHLWCIPIQCWIVGWICGTATSIGISGFKNRFSFWPHRQISRSWPRCKGDKYPLVFRKILWRFFQAWCYCWGWRSKCCILLPI